MTAVLDDIMIEAAQLAGAGFASTVDASGNSTTTVLADAALLDQSPGPDGFAGAWVYRPNAVSSGDKRRRVQGFNEQIAGIVPVRAWTNAPTAGEVYQVYSLFPPYEEPGIGESWRRLVNRGLSNMWYVAEFGCGRGGRQSFPLETAQVTLIAAIAVAGGSGATITAPSGWTLVRSDVQSTNLRLSIYTKRANRNDPIDWTWTLDSSRAAVGFIAAVTDCNPTSPINAQASTTVTPAATTITTSNVTTTQNSELVLAILAGDVATGYQMPSAAVRQLIDVVGDDGLATLGLGLFGAYQDTAGSAGANTYTLTTTARQVGTTIALAIRDQYHAMEFSGYSVGQNGSGATTLVINRPPGLVTDEWTPNREHVRQVLRRSFAMPMLGTGSVLGSAPNEARDIDAGKNGRWWKVLQDGARQTLRLSHLPYSSEDVIAVVQRPYPALVTSQDATDCQLDQAARRAVVECYQYLNSTGPTRGQYSQELQAALQEFQKRYGETRPQPAVVI